MLLGRRTLAHRLVCCSRLQQPRAATASSKRAGATSTHGNQIWVSLCWLVDQIESLGAAYTFTGATAAWLQGADVQYQQLQPLQVSIQWDFMNELHDKLFRLCNPYQQNSAQLSPQAALNAVQHATAQKLCTDITRKPGGMLSFETAAFNSTVLVSCELSTVMQMNTCRVPAACQGRQFWCESLLSIRSCSSRTDPGLAQIVTQRLRELQTELTAANALAWGQAEAVEAWGNKVGSPEEAAAWLQQDPLLRLAPLHKYLPDLQGTRLINLMGSNGSKAVAAALLGAKVTCVDISPANIQYGQQLAQAAGVDVQFVAADVLALPDDVLTGGYDIVLLELGVLHYFIELQPMMRVTSQLLQPGGTLVLREFHPVSTKLLTSKGKKHKVTGDYFSQQLVASEVAYSKYAAAGPGGQDGKKEAATVRLRQWSLGEVVTAVAEAGLMVQRLVEEPGVKTADAGLRKLFTLVATKVVDYV